MGLPPNTPEQRRIQELTNLCELMNICIFLIVCLKSLLDLDTFFCFFCCIITDELLEKTREGLQDSLDTWTCRVEVGSEMVHSLGMGQNKNPLG